MALYLRKVQLSPAVRMGHVKTLEKTSCKYTVRRVEVKVDTVPTGNMNYVQDNMSLRQLPKRLVIACVDSDALNGTIRKTPFDFKHYKRHLHLRNRLLDQSYAKIRLIRSLKKFTFRYQDLVEIYSVSAETIISDAFSYSENV